MSDTVTILSWTATRTRINIVQEDEKSIAAFSVCCYDALHWNFNEKYWMCRTCQKYIGVEIPSTYSIKSISTLNDDEMSEWISDWTGLKTEEFEITRLTPS